MKPPERMWAAWIDQLGGPEHIRYDELPAPTPGRPMSWSEWSVSRSIQWPRSSAPAFLRRSTPTRRRAWLNFLGDEGEHRVALAVDDRKYARLQTVKRRYDPDNLFRLNQNVVPGWRRCWGPPLGAPVRWLVGASVTIPADDARGKPLLFRLGLPRPRLRSRLPTKR